LDDVRDPLDAFAYTKWSGFLDKEWVIVRNYEEFIMTIQVAWEKYSHFPEMIAFDHDLAKEHYGLPNSGVHYDEYEEKTGYDCAKWLIDYCVDKKLSLPEWVCHSMNPAGRDNINMLLRNFKKHQDGQK
jgi:hypothetical protein